MSVTPSDDTHLAGEERRRARDGHAYTLHEFLEHYGDRRGVYYWRSAMGVLDSQVPTTRVVFEMRLMSGQLLATYDTAHAPWNTYTTPGELAYCMSEGFLENEGIRPTKNSYHYYRLLHGSDDLTGEQLHDRNFDEIHLPLNATVQVVECQFEPHSEDCKAHPAALARYWGTVFEIFEGEPSSTRS